MDRTIGFGMLFKTGVYHEVTEVIDGERYSFVSFINFNDVAKIGGRGLI